MDQPSENGKLAVPEKILAPALGAKKPSYKEETIARVLKYFENNPTKSTSTAAEALGLSKGSINEIRSYLIRTQKLSRLIKPPKEGK